MTQMQAATICRDYFMPLTRLPLHTFLILGDIDGETGFVSRPGDDGEAVGFGQWHGDRQKAILTHTKIDVRSAGPLDQCRAMYWEMTTPGSGAHVWPEFMATEDWVAGMTVLVAKYERSLVQGRDVARRVVYAKKWATTFGVNP